MPEPKETRFFARELHPNIERSKVHPATLEQYLAMFAPAGPEQRAGEASPSYLRSQTAASRIAALQPNARIIALLREPASFLRSFHLQALKNRSENEKDLRRALALEDERRQGKRIPHDSLPQALLYSDHVRYVEQLRRFHAVFPPEQVLILIYEDFRRDNEATFREVMRFIDVDETCPVEPIEANATVRVRSPRTNEFLMSVLMGRNTAGRAVKRTVKPLLPKRLRSRAFLMTRRHLMWGNPRPPDEDLMLELRSRFKGEVVALSEYLGRDLVAFWGYDSIG